MDEFAEIEAFLRRVPGITSVFGKGRFDEGNWWIRFAIDIDHSMAWNVIQELGHVLNSLPIVERLPTVFKPISPPSHLNGGPREYLSWVIESTMADFSPRKCAEWLQARLPHPVDDLAAWPQPETMA
jgi:hypothetical protein